MYQVQAPLFPFSGWEEPFQSLEKYGMGRSWEDFVWLPWNVFIHAEIDTHVFQGRLSPVLLVGLWGTQKMERRGIVLLLLGCVFWALGPIKGPGPLAKNSRVDSW